MRTLLGLIVVSSALGSATPASACARWQLPEQLAIRHQGGWTLTELAEAQGRVTGRAQRFVGGSAQPQDGTAQGRFSAGQLWLHIAWSDGQTSVFDGIVSADGRIEGQLEEAGGAATLPWTVNAPLTCAGGHAGAGGAPGGHVAAAQPNPGYDVGRNAAPSPGGPGASDFSDFARGAAEFIRILRDERRTSEPPHRSSEPSAGDVMSGDAGGGDSGSSGGVAAPFPEELPQEQETGSPFDFPAPEPAPAQQPSGDVQNGQIHRPSRTDILREPPNIQIDTRPRPRPPIIILRPRK